MLTEKLKQNFLSMKVEVIDLNIATYYFQRKCNRLEYVINDTSRDFLIEEFHAMRYLENGIILHLTNLDDESSLFSFREVLKQAGIAKLENSHIKSLADKLKKYRQEINSIKVQHRNKRIAHVSSPNDLGMTDFIPFSELKSLVVHANSIADFIWGGKIEYKFKLGTHEGILDYRDLVAKSKVNGKSVKQL